jgi:hypothetical protein
MIRHLTRHIAERAGTMNTAAPPIAPRKRANPGREILDIIDDVVENHGEVIEHLETEDQKRDALVNAVAARYEQANPDLDSDIAMTLVRRGIEEYRDLVLRRSVYA